MPGCDDIRASMEKGEKGKDLCIVTLHRWQGPFSKFVFLEVSNKLNFVISPTLCTSWRHFWWRVSTTGGGSLCSHIATGRVVSLQRNLVLTTVNFLRRMLIQAVVAEARPSRFSNDFLHTSLVSLQKNNTGACFGWPLDHSLKKKP